MDKGKKNKIIGLSIGILIVLIIVVSSTYAYWQITKTQETPNDIVAACLSLDLQDKSPAIDLDSAWPISDEEASGLTGYTFTVTNNCDEEINYIVGLNRVEEDNYLQDSSVKVRLDEQSSHVYGELSDVEYADSENTYTSRVSKQVSVETISANGTNEHTIRVWVSEDAPVSEQSKIFQGQVFITGGQGIEVKECFTIANDGTLLAYNYSCGTEVKVPAEINGVQVKMINKASFGFSNVMFLALYNETTEDEKYMYYVTDENVVNEVTEYLKTEICEDPETCTIADMESAGLILITSNKQYKEFDWEKYETNGYITSDQGASYFNLETGEFEETFSRITSLDLSDAIYLETIGEDAFDTHYESDISDGDHCVEKGENYIGKKYTCKGALKEVVLPQNGVLKTIEEYAFNRNQLTEIIIPASVETIGGRAFAGVYGDTEGGISSISFANSQEEPSQLTKIGYWAFAENHITEITFPDSVKIIENSSFENNNLSQIIFPATIESIGNHAFSGNPLTEVIIKNTEGSVTMDNAFPSTTKITYDPNYTE